MDIEINSLANDVTVDVTMIDVRQAQIPTTMLRRHSSWSADGAADRIPLSLDAANDSFVSITGGDNCDRG